jgi:hypothetical protein
MDRKPAPFDKGHWAWQTNRSHDMFVDLIERAEKAKNDTDREARLIKQLCISCHYIRGRIGGAAMTTQPCACCLKPEMYGSTATDELCLSCADKHNLCKRCGGDIDMKRGRRKWPEPRAKE